MSEPFDQILPADAWRDGASPSVLLFGGSFDPPHAGHTELAIAARDSLPGRPWLVFVPAGRSPFKTDAPTEPRHRVEMIRISMRARSRWWLWTEELRRAQAEPDEPSYWVHTLEAAARQVSPTRIWFLMGADQAAAFGRWHEWKRILELARPVVIGRETIDGQVSSPDAGAPDRDLFESRAVRLETALIDASSTEIRRALAACEQSIQGLDPAVAQYARSRGLYGS